MVLAVHPSTRATRSSLQQLITREAGIPGEARMRNRIIAEAQLSDRMRVTVEREDAPGIERLTGQLEVDVLAVPVAVQFDGDPALRCRFEHAQPVGSHARTAVEDPAARMSEHCDTRTSDGGEHAVRLVVRTAQQRMRRRNHELELGRSTGCRSS